MLHCLQHYRGIQAPESTDWSLCSAYFWLIKRSFYLPLLDRGHLEKTALMASDAARVRIYEFLETAGCTGGSGHDLTLKVSDHALIKAQRCFFIDPVRQVLHQCRA